MPRASVTNRLARTLIRRILRMVAYIARKRLCYCDASMCRRTRKVDIDGPVSNVIS